MKNNKGFFKGALMGALAMLLAVICISCGIKEEKNSAINEETEEKIEKIQGIIDEYYLNDIDEEKVDDALIAGYVNGLEDPYSVYYDEEETKSFMESNSGEYEGIGAMMSQNRDTGIITVLKVYSGSPAEKAGLKDNDILYKVAGKEVTGEDLTEVVNNIKGEAGTTVEMVVYRGEAMDEITVVATREKVEYPTVDYKMMEKKIGYIQISEFDAVTYDQFMNAYNDLNEQGMKGLIVDLRSNPGGSYKIVCEILDELLPEGTIVYTEDKNGTQEKQVSDEEHKISIPLEVLVNGYSASASEIFSGAVQDYGIGDIIGTQTYGKGVVQQIFDLKDGTCLKLTISQYFTPKGRSINGVGITPDIVVEKDDQSDSDNQLEKALETIENKLYNKR